MLRGLNSTFEQVERDTNAEVAESALGLQEKAFALLVAATPVDTANAVGSWAMNADRSLHERDTTGAGNRSALPRETYNGTSYTTNGTAYIEALNNPDLHPNPNWQGSPQADPFFVEEANLRAGLRGTIDVVSS